MKTIRLLYPDYLSGGLDTYYFGAKLLAHILPNNKNQQVFEVNVPKPSDTKYTITDGIYAKDELIKELKDASKIIEENKPDKIITIGGSCLVSQPAFDYLNGLYDNVGVIWIDAHPDVSTAKDGYPNAHAMVLGGLLGEGEKTLSTLNKSQPLKPKNILYIGLQDIHGYQKKFLDNLGVDYKIQTNSFLDISEIQEFAEKFTNVLVHFDIDVLNPTEFHSTYFANPELVGDGSSNGKMSLNELATILRKITEKTDIVGLTIAEYLPFDEERLHNILKTIPIFND